MEKKPGDPLDEKFKDDIMHRGIKPAAVSGDNDTDRVVEVDEDAKKETDKAYLAGKQESGEQKGISENK